VISIDAINVKITDDQGGLFVTDTVKCQTWYQARCHGPATSRSTAAARMSSQISCRVSCRISLTHR
jgi:hypothetical protein